MIGLLLIPAIFAALGVKTGKYPFNLLVVLSLMGLLAYAAGSLGGSVIPLMAALFASAVADWFLNHRHGAGRESFYLYGIVGFFLAHAGYLWYAAPFFEGGAAVWIACAALLIGYGAFLFRRVLPGVEGAAMKVAVCAYALISIAALCFGIGYRGVNWTPDKIAFLLGIAMIVFSDTIIAEADFAGNRARAWLIMPTYYACHILVTASALLRI